MNRIRFVMDRTRFAMVVVVFLAGLALAIWGDCGTRAIGTLIMGASAMRLEMWRSWDV